MKKLALLLTEQRLTNLCQPITIWCTIRIPGVYTCEIWKRVMFLMKD